MISQKILSITAVCELVGRNRRTLWAWVRDGVFPKPIKVHGKTVGWPESVYQRWLAELMEAGLTGGGEGVEGFTAGVDEREGRLMLEVAEDAQ